MSSPGDLRAPARPTVEVSWAAAMKGRRSHYADAAGLVSKLKRGRRVFSEQFSDEFGRGGEGGHQARQVGCGCRQNVFRQTFKSRGRLPRKITLDGYQASHRAVRELLNQHHRGKRTKIWSSKYLDNLIEQDHRSIKLRLGPMLGLKRFRNASITIAGVELIHRIRKGQFKFGTLCIKDNKAPAVWNAVLAARTESGSRAFN